MRVSLSRCDERVSAVAGGLDAALTRTLTSYRVLTRRNFHSPKSRHADESSPQRCQMIRARDWRNPPARCQWKLNPQL
jgi:hypothetical protein